MVIPLILGIVPALFWLLFFLREDEDHPEPMWLIFIVLLAGGVSALFAARLEYIVNGLYPAYSGPKYSSPTIFPFAFIEEVAKMLAVFVIVWKSKNLDERVDVMVFMITAGLGFAALENTFNLMATNFVIEVALIRSVGALVLHALASGIAGYNWARGYPIAGIIFATILHGGFNVLVLLLPPGTEIFSSLLLLGASAFLFREFEVLKARDHSIGTTKEILQ